MEQERQTIANKVIEKLDKENVKPIARWHFTLRNNGFWTLWGLSIVLGACATAATIFVFLNSGWQYQSITHDSFFKFIIDIVPLFWIISIGAMIAFGYFNIRHTKKGYRWSFYLVVFLSIIFSFIGGTFLYALGVGGNIDNIRKPLPFASPIISIEEGRWNDSQRGLLAGVVKSFDKEAELLTIELFSGETKILSTKELNSRDLDLLIPENQIKIIGSTSDTEENFVACVVIPWDLGQRHPPDVFKDLVAERNEDDNRISICKDVRPYQKYKQILITR